MTQGEWMLQKNPIMSTTVQGHCTCSRVFKFRFIYLFIFIIIIRLLGSFTFKTNKNHVMSLHFFLVNLCSATVLSEENGRVITFVKDFELDCRKLW